jgi:ribonuclease PH
VEIISQVWSITFADFLKFMSSSIKGTYGWDFLPSHLPESGSVKPLDRGLEDYIRLNSRIINREAKNLRTLNETRSISLKINLFQGDANVPSGSAYLELGRGTKVLAIANGPLPTAESGSESFPWPMAFTIGSTSLESEGILDESLTEIDGNADETDTSGHLVIHVQYMPFANRGTSVYLTDLSHSLARLVHNALIPVIFLDAYPRSIVKLDLTVLEDDGSLLAALISASSAALADAGIRMKDVAVATSCLVLENFSPPSRLLVIDPNWADERSALHDPLSSIHPVSPFEWTHRANITVTYLPSLNKLAHLHVNGGALTTESLSESIDWCNEVSCRTHMGFKSTLFPLEGQKLPSYE